MLPPSSWSWKWLITLSCLVLIISPWKWLITAALCWKKRHLKQDTCWKHPLNQLRTDNFNFWQFQHFIWKHSTQPGFHNYETPQFVPNQSDYFFATNQRSLFQAAGNAQFNFWHFLWTRPDQIGQTISAEFQVHSLEPFLDLLFLSAIYFNHNFYQTLVKSSDGTLQTLYYSR